MHLAELVNISISYVRELKNTTALATKQLNTIHLNDSLSKNLAVSNSNRSHSLINNQLLTNKSSSSFTLNKKLNKQYSEPKLEETKNENKDPEIEPKKRIGWLSTISIAKTITSHLSNRKLNKIDSDAEKVNGIEKKEVKHTNVEPINGNMNAKTLKFVPTENNEM